MDPESIFDDSDWFEEQYPIAHVELEEGTYPQNPQAHESQLEYNPFVLQESLSPDSVHLTQPDPDTQHPKRKGRPSKKVLSTLRPTRGSQRKRKCPTVMNYDPSSKKTSSEWTTKDKEAFLAGLLDVGIEDIEGLKHYLPNKSESSIKNQIRFWKKLARNNLEKTMREDVSSSEFSLMNSVKNLDEWIKYFGKVVKATNVSQFALSQVFMFIAEFASFPPPEECNGVDFRAMYRYLHCMVNGLPPYGLNSVTASVLYECVEELEVATKDKNIINSLEKHLHEIQGELMERLNKYGRTYEGNSKMKQGVTTIEGLWGEMSLNPLKLPPSALAKVELDSSDDEDDDMYF